MAKKQQSLDREQYVEALKQLLDVEQESLLLLISLKKSITIICNQHRDMIVGIMESLGEDASTLKSLKI